MQRRLIVILAVLATAVLLLFLQNKVMVGSQDLTVELDRPSADQVTLEFKDVAGRPVEFGESGGGASLEEIQEAVERALAGDEKRALKPIPVTEIAELPSGHGLRLTLEDDTIADKALADRLQSRRYRSDNPALPLFNVNLGIDLRGGVEFTARLYNKENEQVPADEVVVGILRKRLDARGLTEPQVYRMTSGEVQVVIPGGTQADAARTRKVLETTGRLEIREVKADIRLEPSGQVRVTRPGAADYIGDPDDVLVQRPGGGWDFSKNYRWEVKEPVPQFTDVLYAKKANPGEAPSEFVHLGPVALTGDDVSDAYRTTHEGEIAVGITFTPAGGKLNYDFGTEVKERGEQGVGSGRFAISLDGIVESDPRVREAAGSQAVISGRFTADEVDSLRTVLKAGSLAVTPRITSERVVGPSLGQETITKGTYSMLAGLLLILLAMWAYYRLRLGTVAVCSLVTTVVLVFVVLSIFGATLTLPGLAGLVLTVGMAVDANILIFERLREELHDDVDVATGVENGYGRAFITILDANLTTFITALILYIVGTGPVKGFGLTLMIGIITSMFGALYVGRLITEWFYHRKEQVQVPGLIGDVLLPYTSLRKLFLPISALAMIASIGYFILGRGGLDHHYDIDFTGGNMVQVTLTEPLTNEEVTAKLAAAAEAGNELLEPNAIQLLPYFADFGEAGGASRQWMFKGRDLEGAALERDRAELEDELAEANREIVRLQTREQEKGEQLTEEKAIQQKQVNALTTQIEELTEQLDERQRIFRDQLRAAFDAVLAEEGAEILAAAWDGNVFSLTVKTLQPASDEALESVSVDLAEHDGVVEASAEAAGTPDDPAVALRIAYETAPQGEIELIRADPIIQRIETLIGSPTSDAERGRLLQAARFYDRAAESLAASAIAVDQPFPSSQHFSPLVGDQMKSSATWAMLIAICAILAYIAARFEFRYGIGAIIALIHDISITLGLLVVFDVRIDLTVVAALLTIIGYSLNDTIVVFDRVRENIAKMGASLAEIIDRSIAQTMSRTIMTSFTTLAVVAILVIFGGEGVNAFATTLLFGLVLGTYSSVFVAAPVLLALNKGKPASALIEQATKSEEELAAEAAEREEAEAEAATGGNSEGDPKPA